MKSEELYDFYVRISVLYNTLWEMFLIWSRTTPTLQTFCAPHAPGFLGTVLGVGNTWLLSVHPNVHVGAN